MKYSTLAVCLSAAGLVVYAFTDSQLAGVTVPIYIATALVCGAIEEKKNG